MDATLLTDDPVISTLFKAVTNQYGSACENPKRMTSASAKSFLENLGISKMYIRRIINELFKDLKFLESLHYKINTIQKRGNEDVKAFYLIKLQTQTAETIAQKILRDNVEQNSTLLYAKLQILRKFQEQCESHELSHLLASSLKKAFKDGIELPTTPKISTARKMINKIRSKNKKVENSGNVINLSDYIASTCIH